MLNIKALATNYYIIKNIANYYSFVGFISLISFSSSKSKGQLVVEGGKIYKGAYKGAERAAI